MSNEFFMCFMLFCIFFTVYRIWKKLNELQNDMYNLSRKFESIAKDILTAETADGQVFKIDL